MLNYIFYTEGRDAALQWHNGRMSIYQDRANGVLTKQMYEWGKESWGGLGAFISPQSLSSVVLKVGSGIEQLDDWIFGDNNNSLERASSAIRSGVTDSNDVMIGNWDAFDFAYNIAMETEDFLAVTFLPGKIGSALSILSTVAQATNDALDRGMPQEQVFWNGLMAGVFEGIFEIWSVGDLRALKKVAANQAKDIALNIAKSMLGNVSDVIIKKAAAVAYDAINNGDFSQYETKVRQYVVNGMTEAEAKKKAALEFGSQVAENIVSDLLKKLIASQR